MAKYGKLNIHKASQCWYCRVNGKMIYLTKKNGSREEAELELAKIRVLESAKEEASKTNDDVKLTILFNLYLEHMKSEVDAETMKNKEKIVKHFLEKFGEYTPKTLTPLMLLQWLKDHDNWQQTYKNIIVTQLRAGFGWMKKICRTTCDPSREIKKPQSKKRSLDCIVSPDDYKALLAVAHPRYQPILTLIWLTGARPKEILGLLGSECDVPGKVINKGKHKTNWKGKSRKILLKDEAVKIIEEAIAKHGQGLLFPSKQGKLITSRWFGGIFNRLKKKAKINKPIIPYGMRHNFAVTLILAGVPITAVAGLLGNSVEVCAAHYAHILENLEEYRKYIA